jgi:hypothetical protein
MQPRSTQFFLQTRCLLRTNFSLQHFCTIHFLIQILSELKLKRHVKITFLRLRRLKYLHFKFYKNPLTNNRVLGSIPVNTYSINIKFGTTFIIALCDVFKKIDQTGRFYFEKCHPPSLFSFLSDRPSYYLND